MDAVPFPLALVLLLLSGWVNRQQQAAIDYLLEENRILRAERGSRRLRLTDDQRRRLAVKRKPLGRRRLGDIAGIVTPDTILRWYRRLVAKKYAGSKTRVPGRPSTTPDIAALAVRMANENPTLYSIRPESQVRREDPVLPREQRADGRGGEAAKHSGAALADQRTEPDGTPGGSAPDCPGQQENGAEGSRESCPSEGRYKGNLPFWLRGRAGDVRRRRTSALLPRSRLGRSDACGLGRR